MKHRTGCSLIGILFTLILASAPALALTDGDWEYIEENGGATITGYTGLGGDVAIPATVGESVAVLQIVTDAFMDNAVLVRVTMPASVHEMGD
ncbi:MAG: hypothetical protein AB3N33_08875, partial [Puniceicoccaceae bacterium]